MRPGFRFRFFYKGESIQKGPIIVKCDQDESAVELVQAFKDFLLAAGYSQQTIDAALSAASQEE